MVSVGALHAALNAGNEEAFDYLYALPFAKINSSALIEAVKGKNVKLIRAVDHLLEGRSFTKPTLFKLGQEVSNTRHKATLLWFLSSRFAKNNSSDIELCTVPPFIPSSLCIHLD